MKSRNVVTAAVVALFAAFWVVAWATSDPPEFPVQYAVSATATAILAVPWVFAARALWRAWETRTSTLDGPAGVVHAATAVLPEAQRGWGRAMANELAQVERGRWRFALGCAWAAVRMRGNVPVLAAGVLVAAAAGVLVRPELRVFAVAFVLLAAVALAATKRRERHLGAGVTGVVATTAAVAVTVYFVTRHPSAAQEFGPAQAVVLAAVLAACLWLAANPLRSKRGATFGVVTAVVTCVGFVVTSRLMGPDGVGLAPYMLFAPLPLFLIGAWLAARRNSFGVGVEAAVHAAVLGTVLVFAASLVEAMHWYDTSQRLLFDGESGYAIGVNLGDSLFWHLLWLPVWGLPIGLIGARLR